MAKIFLTGSTGLVGGQALDALVSAFPASRLAISCLVRNAGQGEVVKKAYPDHVRIVLGDLDDTALITEESRNADIVLQLGANKHMGAAHAIVEGFRQKPTGQPGYYVQMSGASMLVIPEINAGRYGEPSDKVWNDLEGKDEIIAEIRANPSREIDNFILGVDSSPVKTALIAGPLIYGVGEGPGNKRSIQAPNMARKTIADGEGFRLGRGLSTWSNIHVRDLGTLMVKLVQAALNGTSGVWNEDGIYLPGKGSLTFGELSQRIAQEAHAQNLIKSAAIKHVIGPAEANQAMPGGAIFWGTNAVFSSRRAQSKLGWSPSAPSLEKTIPELIRIEAGK